jgi:foldase protein PrsA
MLSFMRKHAGKILIITVVFFVLSIEIPSILGRSGKQDAKRFLHKEFNSQDIAYLDGKPIDSRKFVQIVNQQLNSLVPPQQKSPLDPRIRAQIMYSALLQTVDYTLMLREAKRQYIRVSGGDVKRELQGVKSTYKIPDDKTFNELLKRNGFTSGQFKQMIKDEMMVQKLIRKVQGDVTITDGDIKNRFKRVKVRHILIKTDYNTSGDKSSTIKKADDAALQQAEELYGRLLKGADFGKLAREFSADATSAVNGGAVGWVSPNQMVPEFEAAAYALKKGEISRPVKTVFGYHIIKADDVKEGEVPIDIDEEELKKKMIEERKRTRMDNWYQYLLKKADIEVVARPLLAFKYKMDGDLEKSLREYRLLAAENPADTAGHLFIAEIYETMGNLPEAYAEYQRALLMIKVNPALDNPFIHMGLGALQMRRGERSSAMKEFRKAEELAGDNLVAYGTLQRDYEKYGYPADAKRMERKMAQLRVLFNSDLDKELQQNSEERGGTPKGLPQEVPQPGAKPQLELPQQPVVIPPVQKAP